MKVKILLIIQLTISIFGTIFAFTSVYFDFQRFYLIEGSYTKIKDCVIPNPIMTPCFWGAFGFLAAAIWAFVIYRKFSVIARRQVKLADAAISSKKSINTSSQQSTNQIKSQHIEKDFIKLPNQQKYFSAFALFGTAFAWANMTGEFVKYFNAGGTQYTGCSGATVTNPFLTPCFGGSLIFLILFIFSLFLYKKLKKLST